MLFHDLFVVIEVTVAPVLSVPFTPNIDTPLLIFAATRLLSPATVVAAVVYLFAATAVFEDVPGVMVPPLSVVNCHEFVAVALVLIYPAVFTLDVTENLPVVRLKLTVGVSSSPFVVVDDTLTVTLPFPLWYPAGIATEPLLVFVEVHAPLLVIVPVISAPVASTLFFPANISSAAAVIPDRSGASVELEPFAGNACALALSVLSRVVLSVIGMFVNVSPHFTLAIRYYRLRQAF